jgi:UDP-N-acetylmuramate dehydrogenase
MKLQQHIDLKPFNSFGVSSHAHYLADIQQAADLPEVLEFAHQRQLPVQLLGGGSNILFTGDFPGVVLHMNSRGIECVTETEDAVVVRAAAGENWHHFVSKCLNKGWYGLENLALIPGTVGAAPIQNIGAYGVELEQFFVELEAFDIASGDLRKFSREQCEFAYRDSIFKQASQQQVVLSVSLQLSKRPAPNLSYQALRQELAAAQATPRQVFDAVCKIRREKLPDPAYLGNAGSFFKNPVVSRQKYAALQAEHADLPCYPSDSEDFVKIPAAWLLDAAGWTG